MERRKLGRSNGSKILLEGVVKDILNIGYLMAIKRFNGLNILERVVHGVVFSAAADKDIKML